jgi:hypothetical protein
MDAHRCASCQNHFFNFTPLDEETSSISWDHDGSGKKPPAVSGPISAKQQAANKKLRSGNVQRNEIYKLLCSLCPDIQFELSPGRRLIKSGIIKKVRANTLHVHAFRLM